MSTKQQRLKEDLKFVELQDGPKAVDFTVPIPSDMQGKNREIALVDLQVLERLAENLKRTDVNTIKEMITHKIFTCKNIEEVLEAIELELVFFRTIEQIIG